MLYTIKKILKISKISFCKKKKKNYEKTTLTNNYYRLKQFQRKCNHRILAFHVCSI